MILSVDAKSQIQALDRSSRSADDAGLPKGAPRTTAEPGITTRSPPDVATGEVLDPTTVAPAVEFKEFLTRWTRRSPVIGRAADCDDSPLTGHRDRGKACDHPRFQVHQTPTESSGYQVERWFALLRTRNGAAALPLNPGPGERHSRLDRSLEQRTPRTLHLAKTADEIRESGQRLASTNSRRGDTRGVLD